MRSGCFFLIAAALFHLRAEAVRPHPRVELDSAHITHLRALRAKQDPAWTRFARWLETRPPGDTNNGTVAIGCMLSRVVTGRQRDFDCAWNFVRSKIYRNCVDRAAGLMPILDLYKGDKHTAAYQGGVLLAVIARIYDWGYPDLSRPQREDLVEWMNATTRFEHVESAEGGLYMRNDGASVTQGVAAAVYATLGENPQEKQMIAWFDERWAQTLKALDIIGKGGATGEGNGYGMSPTAAGLITAANIAYTAAGRDLFATHPFFRQRLLFDAFAAYPGVIGGPSDPTRYPSRPFPEQASIAGDGRRAAAWPNRAARRNGLMLARRFAATEEADTWNWVYRQPEVDQAYDDNECVWDLVYYSPQPRLVKPKRLSHFDPSMGFVYIRSDWDSPDATWIAFWAGPHIDTHQHLDQGAFTIFKRRDLAPKTGHMDDNSVFSPHHLAWYTRTISSNGILIGDPGEIFRGFIAGMGCDPGGKVRGRSGVTKWPGCIPNDGGQRTFTPAGGMAVRDAAAFERNRDAYDVARVISARDAGGFVTVVADITNAYNNPRFTTLGNQPKVNRVYRRLVYIRPLDMLAIADTVETTHAEFEKKWLLHALERIEVGGVAERIDPGEFVYRNVDTARIVVDDTDRSDRNQTTFDLRRGYASLLVKTLSSAPFHYRRVGGREPAEAIHEDLYDAGRNAGHFHRHLKDFWIKDYNEGVIPNHKSFNWAPDRPNEAMGGPEYVPVYGPGYGRWRLEIEMDRPAKADHVLNVLKPSLDGAETLPAIRKLDSPSEFGAIITKNGIEYSVRFRKDTLDAPRVSAGR
jgi:hypothetical protein